MFLCGPLAYDPVLELVLGQAPETLDRHAARLRDHLLLSRTDSCFPVLVPAPDETVDGVVLPRLPEGVLPRMRYVAAGMGLSEAFVPLGAGQVRTFRAESAPDGDTAEWARADWQARWGGLAVDALREAMEHYGRFSGADLAVRMPMLLSRAEARAAARSPVPADLRSGMRADAVDCLSRRNAHAGFFLTREYRLRHPVFGGGLSPEVTREVFVATDAAIVLPYDPVRDRVLMVEQFRMGPYGRGDPLPWMLEPVAGRVDAGESPETAAYRECREEADLALRGLEHVAGHYCSPGCSTEYFQCYIGFCDLPDAGRDLGGAEAENEDIRRHVVSFDRAMELLRTGEADNGPLILCLLWLERERARLRAAP